MGRHADAIGGPQQIPRPDNARPGPNAPWAGAPQSRRRLSLDQVTQRLANLPPPVAAQPLVSGTRRAAVLVPLFEEGGEARVILTRRPDTMPTHQGQVAFPGGAYEADRDADLRATALRETSEEIGIAPERIQIVAELDGLATVESRFTIAPFVGVFDGRPELDPDRYEVVRVFDISLADLMAPGVFHSEIWGRRPGFPGDFVVNFFRIPGETIWGATARILTRLLEQVAV